MLINRSDEAQVAELASQFEELRKSGLAPHPQSPAGRAQLLVIKQHLANLENRETAAAVLGASVAVAAGRSEAKKHAKKAAKLRKAGRADSPAGPALEDRAMRRGLKRTRSALDSGMSAADALLAGFDAYQEEGGRLTSAGFRRKIAGRMH